MLCLHKATLSIVGRFHRISLTSIHFTPFMVMELILLRKFKKCQEIFGWLQYMPFCSICAVFHSISMNTYQGWPLEKTHLKKPGFFKVGFLGFFKRNLEKTQKFWVFSRFLTFFRFFSRFFRHYCIFEIFFLDVQEIIKT